MGRTACVCMSALHRRFQLFDRIMELYLHSYTYLVGGFNPSEKYSSVGVTIPNIWENKKCSKPPTRYTYICIYDDIEILMRPLIKKAWSKVLTSVLLLPFPQKLLLQRQAMNYHRF